MAYEFSRKMEQSMIGVNDICQRILESNMGVWKGVLSMRKTVFQHVTTA